MKAKNDTITSEGLLQLLGGGTKPDSNEFKELVLKLDNQRILAKFFLLEGTPFVFAKSPMKYVVFQEQVADKFGIGSQDVCIVGSAKLGYSPSPNKFGEPFSQASDVDVVIISDEYFYKGSKELFSVLNHFPPSVYEVNQFIYKGKDNASTKTPNVELKDWRIIKDAIRNFVFENFNPGLLPQEHYLRKDIFDKITSTAGIFWALEPQVFVSKIRCRIFKSWKAAEDYYANSLRDTRSYLLGEAKEDAEATSED